MGGLFQINPVTKTGQRLYMVHMLLLPFLPITALIIQNSTTLNELLQYQTEVQRIGEKVKLILVFEKKLFRQSFKSHTKVIQKPFERQLRVIESQFRVS